MQLDWGSNMIDINTETLTPVCVSVPVGDLRRLCKLAKEAGEDLQQAARETYPNDNPSSVRRRDNEIQSAQQVIDAAAVIKRSLGEDWA
jgi:hypothetical protein